MDHAAKAISYFNQGYNCAQAVLLAYAEELSLDADTAARISASFGGGMGKQGEVCGAVSAMFMVEGLRHGSPTPSPEAQKALYARVRALGAAFKNEYGTLLCRELLPLAMQNPPRPDGSRPCGVYVEAAARLLEDEERA